MEDLLSPEFTGKLDRLARESSEIYKSNEPFPHIVF